MPLLDCVIFSALLVTRFVGDNFQPAPCLPPPARSEAMPSVTAGDAARGEFAIRLARSFTRQ
jgi:hypothetical protein